MLYNTEGLVSWISAQEFCENEGLIEQVVTCEQLPMRYMHIALMADAHSGYGMPIGGVMALDDGIAPFAVGYDISCGVLAIETEYTSEQIIPKREEIFNSIKRGIPLGKGGRNNKTNRFANKDILDNIPDPIKNNKEIVNNIYGQIGTLGSNNHFISLEADSNNKIWAIIHSGSRGCGHDAAHIYMKKADESCAKHWSKIHDGYGVLRYSEPEGQEYKLVHDYFYAWASENRNCMMKEVLSSLSHIIGESKELQKIETHHNYAAKENHMNKNVIIHRKGAVNASLDRKLVIPGNMGQGTAICVGKGNIPSFRSCSHGAGRKFSRAYAKENLEPTVWKDIMALDNSYLFCDRECIDEQPDAYKNFDDVLFAQEDLISVAKRLKPVITIKG